MKKIVRVRARIVLVLLLMGFIAGLRIAPARADAPERIIIINTSGNTLTLYENGQLAKKYIVASGRHSSPTPTGIYKIVSKSKKLGLGLRLAVHAYQRTMGPLWNTRHQQTGAHWLRCFGGMHPYAKH